MVSPKSVVVYLDCTVYNMTMKICSVVNCDNLGLADTKGRRYLIHGLCNKHYLRNKRHGDVNFVKRVRNGQKANPLYSTHRRMIQRCTDINSRDYHRYGGRGITICGRWSGPLGFTNFLSDMGNKPSPNHSIERVDNSKGYNPSNCRWATANEQASNKRNNNLHVGVRWIKRKKRWGAYLNVNKNRYHKSGFISLDEAIAYRKYLESKYLVSR
jgi:hypothetical protein